MHAPTARTLTGGGASPSAATRAPFSLGRPQHGNKSAVQAAPRQGPEPWLVEDPLEQQTTAWQQRQAQHQQRTRQRQPRQKPGQQSSNTGLQPSQPAAVGAGNSTGPFSSCSTFAQLDRVLQQMVRPAHPPGQQQEQQPQPEHQDPSDSQQQAGGEEQQDGDVPQPPAVQLVPLSLGDLVGLVYQLEVCSTRSSSSTTSSGSSPNPFVEDQALQHVLAVVYVQLDQLLLQQQQGLLHPDSTLPPQQLLRCVSTLAGLKYSQPEQLASWLQAAADGASAASGVPTAAGSTTTAAAASGPAAGADYGSYRDVLKQLPLHELSALIANLARAGVRPSNAWLLAFMQVSQSKLSFPGPTLPQCAAVLSGLVKVGVRPTTAWLDTMEARAVQCLLENAVRQQLAAERLQHAQAQEAAAAVAAAAADSGSRDPARQKQQSPGKSRSTLHRTAEVQLHHVAQLLCALAEARHAPKPQLAAVLWSASAASLAEQPQVGALVELIAALGELQLVPPGSWLQQYFAAAAAAAPQARPWQLASTIAGMGRLAAASRMTGPQQYQQQQQQQQQQQVADIAGCNAWVDATLAAVQQRLPDFAARDLAALLSGLAALQVQQLPAQQVQLLLEELQGKLPRVNTAGLAAVAEAVAAFGQQWRRQQQPGAAGAQQQKQQGPAVVFMEALLREVAVKLPVFPAEDLARVLLAVAAEGTRPTGLWLQAVAAQLSTKLTLLPPATLVAVLSALVQLGSPPEQRWVLQAAAALDGQLLALPGPELQQLLALLVSMEVALPGEWLDRADQAAQQAAQGAELLPSAGSNGQELPASAAAQQVATCQQLIDQLRQRQLAAGGSSSNSSSSGAPVSPDSVEVEVAG